MDMNENMQIVQLKKVGIRNDNITTIIGGTIEEYDIESAHTYAMRKIKGEKTFDKLMAMNKRERNILIGKMQINNKTLVKALGNQLLDWLNEFLANNNIRAKNFIESTRDSVTIFNKVITNTVVDGGAATLRTKGMSWTSMYRISPSRTVFYDGMLDTLRIKGINLEISQSSPFVNEYLIPFVREIENTMVTNPNNLYKIFIRYRDKYINASNKDILRVLNRKNMFIYHIKDPVDGTWTELESSAYLPETPDQILNKNINYVEFIMPIFKQADRTKTTLRLGSSLGGKRRERWS